MTGFFDSIFGSQRPRPGGTPTLYPVIRTPRQSSDIFGLDGESPIRQKHVFYMRFRRSVFREEEAFLRKTSVVVKSIDRPAIQPKIEELNQYNKKRIVYTGWQPQQLKITFFDTAANEITKMWDLYSRYYFGDFHQRVDMHRYDITTERMLDNGAGFGFVPQNSGREDDLNTPYWLEAIEIYQVYGGSYNRIDLVNPKITSFDPDELDYENSSPAMITMTVAVENILPFETRSTKPLDGPAKEAFDTDFNGSALEVSGPRRATQFGARSPAQVESDRTQARAQAEALRRQQEIQIRSYGNRSGAGSLTPFGDFNFGAAAGVLATRAISGRTRGSGSLAQEIAYVATGSPALGTILGLGSSTNRTRDIASVVLSSAGTPSGSLDAAVFDAARNAIGVNGSMGPYGRGYAATVLTQGIMTAGGISGTAPRDQILWETAPSTAVLSNGRPWSSGQPNNGLAFTPQTYGAINALNAPHSQVGFRATQSQTTGGAADAARLGL